MRDSSMELFYTKRDMTSRRVLAYWSLLHYLPNGTQALTLDVPQGVFEKLSVERGFSIMRLPHRGALERCGRWVEPQLSGAMSADDDARLQSHPTLLGKRPGVREYLPALHAGLRATPPERMRVRVRALPQLLASMKNVGVLHVNDPAYLDEALGDDLNELCRRKLVICFPVGSKIATTLAALVRAGFKLYDDEFFEITPDVAVEGNTCIAVPAGLDALVNQCASAVRYGDVDGLRTGRHAVLPARTSYRPLSSVNDVVSKLQRTIGISSPLLRLLLGQREVALPFGHLASSNWYALEGGADYAWRWSGPGAESRMFVPVPGPGSYELVLKIMGVASQECAQNTRFFVAGRRVPVVRQVTAGELIRLPFDVREQDWIGGVELMIALPRTYRPNPDDPRQLGIAIDLVKLHLKGES